MVLRCNQGEKKRMTDSSNQAQCSICRKHIDVRPANEHFPFCSEHCRQIDLGRWLNEDYSLRVHEDEMERRIPDELELALDESS